MTDNLENLYYKKYIKYKAKYLDLVERMRGGVKDKNYSRCKKYDLQPFKDQPSYNIKTHICENGEIKKKDNIPCKTQLFGSECKSGSECLNKKCTPKAK